LRDELPSKKLPFRSTQVKLWQLMHHVPNHSTYHRPQVSWMMRRLGAKPAATDFHRFLVDGERVAALPWEKPLSRYS